MTRNLILRKISRAIQEATDGLPQDDLPDGHMRLYSFFKPSLEAGSFALDARQTVSMKKTDPLAATNPPLNIWNYKGVQVDNLTLDAANIPAPSVAPQLMSVAAPQFNLDPKVINTFYPPAGHQDAGRILPHIVFNDPHMPWLRYPGLSDPFHGPVDLDTSPDPKDPSKKIGFRNMVPWMALMVFDPAELKVSPPEATAIGLDKLSTYNAQSLPLDGAFSMKVGEYLTGIPTNRIYFEAGYTEPATKADLEALKISQDGTSIIFPTRARLEEIIGDKSTLNDKLSNQKFMAHVRHIKTDGFPDAGVQEDGWYSLVVSSMTGGVAFDTPTSQVVHLVSLEHYDSTVTDPASPFNIIKDLNPLTTIIAPTDRVGIVSLFSWIYTCIPEPIDFVETMTNLTAKMQPLRPPDSLLGNIQQGINTQSTPASRRAAQMLYNRLSESYTINRWRTCTGEETVAYNRGPLVASLNPAVPSNPATNWPALSMSGKDYQIFDQNAGIMDLSYSSAWSLGKLAGISDSPFNAALLRFRSLIWQQAASDVRMVMNGIQRKSVVLAQTTSAIRSAQAVEPNTFTGPVSRINPPSTDTVAPPLKHPDVAPGFAKAIIKAVDVNASDQGEKIYNDFELSKAANSDWELIHNWISNTLYLGNIPSHVLFPEPTHIKGDQIKTAPTLPNVPPEALRFFYIDHAWIDSFIDGALGCANHLEPQYDMTRLRIKEVYNYYLRSTIHPLEGVTPPAPRYGFVLRSSVVKAIPDLKTTVTCRTYDPTTSKWVDSTRDPVVRLSRLDAATILCLLDCLPEEISNITFSQPPHQRRFALGAGLTAQTLPDGTLTASTDVIVKMLYTQAAPTGSWEPLPENELHTLDQSSFYNANTRCINPKAIADNVRKLLTNTPTYPNDYQDPFSNSLMLGLTLNDPSYQFIISGPTPPSAALPDWTRQLWTGEESSVPHRSQAVLTSKSFSPAILAKSGATDPVAISHPPALNKADLLPQLPLVSRLNSANIVANVAVAAGPVGTLDPQFTLVIHPDYRPPPPTLLRTSSNQIVSAPMDYIPTQTTSLFDLILAIRRKSPASATVAHLAEITVEMPISDGSDLDQNGVHREPLFEKGFLPPSCRMTNNQRFVPTVYTSPDPKFPSRSVLGIKLIPRSAQPDATIIVTNNQQTDDASVRLTECAIAKIVNKSQVQVAGMDASGNGTGSSQPQVRGVCKITLTEVYVMGDGTRQKAVTDGELRTGPGQHGIPLWALKRDGGDADLNGVAV